MTFNLERPGTGVYPAQVHDQCEQVRCKGVCDREEIMQQVALISIPPGSGLWPRCAAGDRSAGQALNSCNKFGSGDRSAASLRTPKRGERFLAILR
jgi:hypothetical protein